MTTAATRTPKGAIRGRSRLPSEERKANILAAAQDVLAESGYENAAVAEVARRAGVVEGTVYHHFETKRELFIRVAETWYQEALAQQPAYSMRGSTLERLREMIRLELMLISKHPRIVRFILMEVRPDPNYRDMAIFRMSRKFTSGILDVLRAGVHSGELTDAIPLRVARDMIFGGIEHQTWAYLRSEGDFDIDEAAHALASITYKGLVKELPPGPNAICERLDRLEQMVAALSPKA